MKLKINKKLFVILTSATFILSGCKDNNIYMTKTEIKTSETTATEAFFKVYKDGNGPYESSKDSQVTTVETTEEIIVTTTETTITTTKPAETTQTAVETTKPVENTTTEETTTQVITSTTEETSIPSIKSDEQEVISTIDNLYEDVKTTIKNGGEIALNSLKAAFIYTVDFIFYGTEINGYTFDELGVQAKEDTLDTVSRMDGLIEQNFPNYKNEISTLSTNIYEEASDIIKRASINISEFTKNSSIKFGDYLEEKIGTEEYNNIIEVKDSFINKTSEVIDSGKDFISDVYDDAKEVIPEIYEDGKNFIKNWYEGIRN